MKNFSQRFKYTFTVIYVFTIIITSVMDVNETHMTNPLWPPHARFHWAVQYFSAIMVSLLGLYGIWTKYKDKGGHLSILCIGIGPLLSWGMFIPAFFMPGASTAPDGINVPENLPDIFTIIHPNFLIACLITLVSVLTISKEYKRKNP